MNVELNNIEFNIDGYREARLDQVIAQELHADFHFAEWLWSRSGSAAHGNVIGTNVRMNHDDTVGFPIDAHGETDVHCVLTSSSGSRSELFIENKVWAAFQPTQPERYRRRADHVGGRALLIAPSVRLATESPLLEFFDGQVAIEDIATWFAARKDRRGEWLAELLLELVRPVGRESQPDDANTVAFTSYCVDWLSKRTPLAIPAPLSLHTTGQGWLDFETPAALVYKVVGIRRDKLASVDMYVKYLQLDEPTLREAQDADPCTVTVGGESRAFHFASDTKNNLILRFDIAKLLPSEGVPIGDELATLHLALEACAAAAEWVERVNNRFGG